MPLDKRTFECENCGNVIDRDKNASLNIKDNGLEIILERIKSFKEKATDGQSGSYVCGDAKVHSLVLELIEGEHQEAERSLQNVS